MQHKENDVYQDRWLLNMPRKMPMQLISPYLTMMLYYKWKCRLWIVYRKIKSPSIVIYFIHLHKRFTCLCYVMIYRNNRATVLDPQARYIKYYSPIRIYNVSTPWQITIRQGVCKWKFKMGKLMWGLILSKPQF